MKLNLKLRFTNFLVKYWAGFAEIILRVSKCFAFSLQVYETWLGRVITPLSYKGLYVNKMSRQDSMQQ